MSSDNILQTDNMNKYYYKNKDKHNNRKAVLFSLGCSQLCILIIKHKYRKVYILGRGRLMYNVYT